MFTVYVLKGENGTLYKGMTTNLKRRFREHLNGHTRTTSRMGNLTIIHTEEYETWDEARKRERYLKTSAGRTFLKKLLGR